jgi:hypothetical protein
VVTDLEYTPILTPLTPHDTPEAALRRAIGQWDGFGDEAAAILAAMPDWVLVPRVATADAVPDVHVYPLGEGHEMSEDCWCHPKVHPARPADAEPDAAGCPSGWRDTVDGYEAEIDRLEAALAWIADAKFSGVVAGAMAAEKMQAVALAALAPEAPTCTCPAVVRINGEPHRIGCALAPKAPR